MIQTCSICAGTLVQTSPSTWECRTPDCVGGVQRFTCGFCRAPSFSLRKRSCINPDCRTHGLVREPCPTCNNFSVVTLDGISFCINRGCPAVAGSIGTCPICQTKSLIRTARYTVCVKSTCSTLLKPVAFTSITTSPKPVAAPDKPAATAQKVTDRIAKPAAPASADPSGGNAAPDRTSAGPNGPAASKSDEAKPSTQTADDLDPWGMTRGIELATIPQGPGAAPSTPGPPPSSPSPPPSAPAPPIDPPAPPLLPPAPELPSPSIPTAPVQSLPTEPPLAGWGRPVVLPDQPPAPWPPVVPGAQSVVAPAPSAAPAVDQAATLRPADRLDAPAPPPPGIAPSPTAPPGPPAPAKPDLAAELRRAATASDIEHAWEFLLRTVLANDEQELAPIVLVFGLAGSGKSTYLTMLGEILTHGAGKYHFPYPGVAVRSLHVDSLVDEHLGAATPAELRARLRRRIRDLCFDFAEKNYNEFLVNGAWVPATVRETGGEAAHSFFLLSELIQGGAVLGRIVTIETSGEDFQEVLRRLGTTRNAEELESPLHRVLYRLVDAATGIAVLLDPGSHDNDQQYSGLLRIIKEEIEPRAAHALAKTVDARLAAGVKAGAAAPDPGATATFAAAVLDETERKRREELAARERRALAEQLREAQTALAATASSHQALAAFAARHGPFMAEIEQLARTSVPELAAQADALFAEHGRNAGSWIRFYQALLKHLATREAFEKILDLRVEVAMGRSREAGGLVKRILDEQGLPDTGQITEQFLARWKGRPTGRRFERLRHLALVVTKSDRHPIVYPPSDYPKFKLPMCWTHLAAVEAYLGLLGGGMRYYNATAIGYAVQRGHQYGPGPGNSFTPVNIVEPLLDVLLAEAV